VDGSELGTNFGAPAQTVTVGGQDLLPIVSTAFTGQPVGSRILVATNKAGDGQTWSLFVFDITSATTIPTAATGEPVEPLAGLPAVTVENGVPTIAKPEGDAPPSLVIQPLVQGTGPALASGQTATIQYVGMIWSSGTVFQSSWSAGAVQLVVSQNIPGFDEGLVGQTVGSRVMIVIPPDKGYGADGNPQAGIGGTDTILFVVDILAAS
jgi:peptidylprolyl isomerase